MSDTEVEPDEPAKSFAGVGVKAANKFVDVLFKQGPVAIVLAAGICLGLGVFIWFAKYVIPQYHADWREDRNAAEARCEKLVSEMDAKHVNQINELASRHRETLEAVTRAFDKSLDRMEVRK